MYNIHNPPLEDPSFRVINPPFVERQSQSQSNLFENTQNACKIPLSAWLRRLMYTRSFTKEWSVFQNVLLLPSVDMSIASLDDRKVDILPIIPSSNPYRRHGGGKEQLDHHLES